MDTIAERWAKLEPHAITVGPDDETPRPTALLFHGCGGLRDHLPLYAQAAKDAGWRAIIVDSFGARGWSREYSLMMVCSGLQFRGDQRAGDVLAALHGAAQRPDVDETRLAVAGWSHGGWGIMEALSADRSRPSLGVADPDAVDLDSVRGAFLAYPYVGLAALNSHKPWRHRPRTLGVIARSDHLTTVGNARRCHEVLRGCGVEVETWVADGTHSFDEPTGTPPMRHDPVLTEESTRRFRGLLDAVA